VGKKKGILFICYLILLSTISLHNHKVQLYIPLTPFQLLPESDLKKLLPESKKQSSTPEPFDNSLPAPQTRHINPDESVYSDGIWPWCCCPLCLNCEPVSPLCPLALSFLFSQSPFHSHSFIPTLLLGPGSTTFKQQEYGTKHHKFAEGSSEHNVVTKCLLTQVVEGEGEGQEKS
jgi:hypothetical protein